MDGRYLSDRLVRLVRLLGTDEGFYVLALHSCRVVHGGYLSAFIRPMRHTFPDVENASGPSGAEARHTA